MPGLKGNIIAESPIYRGNMKNTLFTRENKPDRTPVELPGVIKAPADRMGDAFICGENYSKKKQFNKLLPQLYKRLFGGTQNEIDNFFRDINISCIFNDRRSIEERFYDLRMGIKINRDSMTMVERDGNYKMETLFKGTSFNFSIDFPDNFSKENRAKLAILLGEMEAGRFWFGGAKKKGCGKLKLILDTNSNPQEVRRLRELRDNNSVRINNNANIIIINLTLRAENPLLVSWSLGHKEKGSEGVVDRWIDEEIKKTTQHRNDCNLAARGRFKETSREFQHEHQGKKITPEQYKMGAQNDENLIAFLKWFKGKVTDEIWQDHNLDFRLDSGRKKVVRDGASSKPYDLIFMRMLKWVNNSTQQNPSTGWEVYIPGSTLKGAFKIRAEKIINFFTNYSLANNRNTDLTNILHILFGAQGKGAMVTFSDAYLTNPENINEKFSSCDSIRIDPATGKPDAGSKMDYLFAYGKDPFTFKTTLYLQDININDENHKTAIGLLFYLLKDFTDGLIPFGGQKTSGMGWIKGEVENIEILAGDGNNIFRNFGIQNTQPDNCWQKGSINYNELIKSPFYSSAIKTISGKLPQAEKTIRKFSLNKRNLISHWGLSGKCGRFSCQLEVLTPLHIKESGEPSKADLTPQGWDFYSISPPSNGSKPQEPSRIYAIPSKTIKGAIRNLYSIITQTDGSTFFGFTSDSQGSGSYMGRINVSFAKLNQGDLAWFSMPHHYKSTVQKITVGGNSYSVFPHTNKLDSAVKEGIFTDPTYTPCRCVKPGAEFSFTVDFWNLTDEEFINVLWCLNGRCYKIGKGKSLGFGSCRITINEQDSFLYNWDDRYRQNTPGTNQITLCDATLNNNLNAVEKRINQIGKNIINFWSYNFHR